jgi:hypothetical protein
VVDVSETATSGIIDLGSTVSGTTLNSTLTVSDSTAITPDTWIVQEQAELTVLSTRPGSDTYVLEDGMDTSVTSDTFSVDLLIKNTGGAHLNITSDTTDIVIENQLDTEVTEEFSITSIRPDTPSIPGGETVTLTYEGTLPDRSSSEVLGPVDYHVKPEQPVGKDANSGVDVSDTDGASDVGSGTIYRSIADTSSFTIGSPDERLTARVPENKYSASTLFTVVMTPSNSCISEANQKAINNDDRGVPSILDSTINQIIATEPARNGEKTIELDLSYLDSTLESEDKLKIFGLNESECKWEVIQPHEVQEVNVSGNTITARIDGFSFFRIMVYFSAADDLSDLKIGPNPYRPNDGNPRTGIPYNGSLQSGIHFLNLTERVEIRIYNIHGTLVAEFSSNDSQGAIQWDARNMQGAKVASGVYLYQVESKDTGEIKTGKIAIIR